ncbi:MULTISPECIES: hypothetical protein [unclassified Streptomyces]|uniref:hypothetical protein n=1 Tax=unclassified Streptomyces TaxID=2593676 RepID=UPI001BEA9A1A|nr:MULTISPECIES: hypothetical protein [unclassified Streptomyces]MBT2405333.1 hypothetical protein [Streptomyces sp. ISL-21]MBT2454300.1 hypothetical protein [Streptomyces sp. ISL-86]MBT2613808.1 hypothetical protein [Streptomyces sp. ISL-87]
MNTWRAFSHAPKPQEALDPYRFPGVRGFEGKEDTRLQSSVPTPDPEERPLGRISAAHHRRLDLHAALTAAGIPPLAGDLQAIEAVSALDDTTNAAIQRWIAGTR